MLRLSKHFFIGLIFLFSAGAALAIEEPKFSVTEQSGDFELRTYKPMIVAETFVSGAMDRASGAGFKLIADYIFGNNTSSAGGNAKISMTAPVTMEPKSEKINMTAPVSMEQADGKWRVHFVMPSEYTMATLPKPNNPAVKIRQVPVRKYAVVRFSGFSGEAKLAKKTAELKAWLKAKGIQPRGKVEVARYDPPWTLPFMRRNEVMIPY
ncbi:MAG: SOUL family heme-binding protein [Thiolinea sp.]